MSILDQIASGGTPPVNPLDTLGKLQSLRTGQMQQQGLALENQQRQQAANDQQALTKAYQEWDGRDYSDLAHLAVKNGATGTSAMAIQKHALDTRKMYSDMAKTDSETGKNNLEMAAKQNDLVAGHIANLQNVPDDQLGQAVIQTAQQLSQARGYDGKPLLDPQHVQSAQQIAQMPPEQQRAALSMFQKDFMAQSQQIQAAKTASEIKAAGYKEAGGVLYDISGNAPQPTGPMTTADNVTAGVLGMKAGDKIPLAVAKNAKETAAVGVKETDFNGKRQIINTLDPSQPARVLGNSPAVTTFNMQNAVPKGENGQPSQLAQMVANGQMKWNDAVSARWPLGTKAAFAAEVKSINPNFNSGDFTVEQKVREKYTSGNVSDQLRAIGTAREHMKLFGQLADALANGNVQAANQIGNAFGVQFGNDAATNFKIASQAFGGEVGKALDGASVTAGEREQAAKSFNENMSPQQFRGAVHTVDGLLAGKQKSAQDAFDKESKGKPNFGNASGAHVIQVGSKKYQYKGTGATDDLSNYTEIGK